MSHPMPSRPSLEHLKKQAKALQEAVRAGEPGPIERYRAFFAPSEPPTLARIQLVLAREYGYESWAEIKRAVLAQTAVDYAAQFVDLAFEGRLDEAKRLLTERAAELREDVAVAATAGDAAGVARALANDPSLATTPVGPRACALILYPCFSRIVADPALAPGIRDVCRLLLRAGADPNAFRDTKWHDTDVHETALYGAGGVLNDPELTEILLTAGADPNDGSQDPNHYHGESLYHACDHPGRNECLRLILEAGPLQVAKDYCLRRKLDFEDVEGIALFLTHGANPNSLHPRTALSHAVLRGRSRSVLELLIAYGADPNLREADGSNVYALARMLGNREATTLFEEHGAWADFNIGDQLLIAAAEGNEPEVRRLTREHPGLATTFTGQGRQADDGAPLGMAGQVLQDLARLGNAKGLSLLLDLGADPSCCNQWNETPLHWAALAGRAEAAAVLLSRGAALDVRENNHQSDPLGWAIWGSEFWNEPHGDYASTVNLILDAGAALPNQIAGSPEVQAVLSARRL